MTDRAWFHSSPAAPLDIDSQVTTPLIWVLYYTIQRINYLKTIRFHCFGSRVSCLVQEAEKGFPIAQHGIPWRHHACTCFTKYTFPVSTQVLAKSGVENEKKSSNSYLISVSYGHYLVNFTSEVEWNCMLPERWTRRAGKPDRHRIEHAGLAWFEVEHAYM